MSEQHNRALVLAGHQLQRVMLDLIREAYSEKAVERRPRYEGDRLPEPTPTPMAGLWAAIRVARLARREEMRQARRAREVGYTWDEIGDALELEEPRDGRTVADAAYESFAGSLPSAYGHEPSFIWRCPACSMVISDRGPYDGHPDASQLGHAKDCSRLATEIERWQSSWDEGDLAKGES